MRDEIHRRMSCVKIRYDPEADVLALVLRSNPPVDGLRNQGEFIVSYGEDGEPVSVEFLNASVRQLITPGEVSVTIHAGKL